VFVSIVFTFARGVPEEEPRGGINLIYSYQPHIIKENQHINIHFHDLIKKNNYIIPTVRTHNDPSGHYAMGTNSAMPTPQLLDNGSGHPD